MAVRESKRVDARPALVAETFVVIAWESCPPVEGDPLRTHVFEFPRLDEAFEVAMRWPSDQGDVEVWLGRSRLLYTSMEQGTAGHVVPWSGPSAPGCYAVSYSERGDATSCDLLGPSGHGVRLLESGRYAGAL